MPIFKIPNSGNRNIKIKTTSRTFKKPGMVLISFNCDRCGERQDFRPRQTFGYGYDRALLCDRCLKPVPFDAYATRNHALKQMGFETYQDYLKSDKWKLIRESVLSRDGSKCVFCPKPATNVHHHIYSIEALIGTDLKPLHSLCGGCHYGIEFDKDGKKLEPYATMKKLRQCLKHKCTPYDAGSVIREKTKAFREQQRATQLEKNRRAAAENLSRWFFTEIEA